VTIRLPHSFVGALCVGFALANLGRLPAFPALLGATALAGLGLAAGDPRVRWPAVAAALVAVAWGWGSARLGQLDHSVLASRIGTFERALVEIDEPPRAGAFDQRMRALVLRWGTLRTHEPVLLELPLGRAPPQGAWLELLGELRGSARALERLRRGEVAAPAGHPRGSPRADMAHRRPAGRRLGSRRPRRALARRRQHRGTCGR